MVDFMWWRKGSRKRPSGKRASDRRRQRRIDSDTRQLTCALGSVTDLSLAGMRVCATQKPPLKVGQKLEFAVQTDHHYLVVQGRIIWRRRQGVDRHDFGVQFLHVDPKVALQLVTLACYGRLPGDPPHPEADQADGEVPDLYVILGLARTATSDQIRAAYHALARRFHPDANREEGADSRFMLIAEAYKVLRQNESRAAYDHLLGPVPEQAPFEVETGAAAETTPLRTVGGTVAPSVPPWIDNPTVSSDVASRPARDAPPHMVAMAMAEMKTAAAPSRFAVPKAAHCPPVSWPVSPHEPMLPTVGETPEPMVSLVFPVTAPPNATRWVFLPVAIVARWRCDAEQPAAIAQTWPQERAHLWPGQSGSLVSMAVVWSLRLPRVLLAWMPTVAPLATCCARVPSVPADEVLPGADLENCPLFFAVTLEVVGTVPGLVSPGNAAAVAWPLDPGVSAITDTSRFLVAVTPGVALPAVSPSPSRVKEVAPLLTTASTSAAGFPVATVAWTAASRGTSTKPHYDAEAMASFYAEMRRRASAPPKVIPPFDDVDPVTVTSTFAKTPVTPFFGDTDAASPQAGDDPGFDASANLPPPIRSMDDADRLAIVSATAGQHVPADAGSDDRGYGDPCQAQWRGNAPAAEPLRSDPSPPAVALRTDSAISRWTDPVAWQVVEGLLRPVRDRATGVGENQGQACRPVVGRNGQEPSATGVHHRPVVAPSVTTAHAPAHPAIIPLASPATDEPIRLSLPAAEFPAKVEDWSLWPERAVLSEPSSAQVTSRVTGLHSVSTDPLTHRTSADPLLENMAMVFGPGDPSGDPDKADPDDQVAVDKSKRRKPRSTGLPGWLSRFKGRGADHR